jgi:hypothetical protein
MYGTGEICHFKASGIAADFYYYHFLFHFTVVVLFIPVGPFMGTTHSKGHTIPVCDDSVTKSKTL